MNPHADPQSWTPDAIRHRLQAILKELASGIPSKGHYKLAEDYGLDSIRMLAFITCVEKEFGVSIGGKEIENNVLTTFDNLLSFLHETGRCRAVVDPPT
jgi:acyl carrier protein